jgi:hypothetical protein
MLRGNRSISSKQHKRQENIARPLGLLAPAIAKNPVAQVFNRIVVPPESFLLCVVRIKSRIVTVLESIGASLVRLQFSALLQLGSVIKIPPLSQSIEWPITLLTSSLFPRH